MWLISYLLNSFINILDMLWGVANAPFLVNVYWNMYSGMFNFQEQFDNLQFPNYHALWISCIASRFFSLFFIFFLPYYLRCLYVWFAEWDAFSLPSSVVQTQKVALNVNAVSQSNSLCKLIYYAQCTHNNIHLHVHTHLCKCTK